MTFLRHSDFE